MPYRILVTDQIDPDGIALLAAEPEFQVDETPTLSKDELLSRIPFYDALIGRSATRLSADVLQTATNLKVIGRAGVGVDNIAIDTATRLGIAVINAPAGNTIAVAELFFGVLLGILRQLPDANYSMRHGRWDRARLMGTELYGKTLGIVGLGRIGGEVAKRAQAFGLTVQAYDPYVAETRFESLNVTRVDTLEALLPTSHILTVHVPLTQETLGMINERELQLLRRDAIVVNMARGGIIDEGALATALTAGRIRAAAIDAFIVEPLPADSPLRILPNLFLTPHMGASTLEAQRNVALDACTAVRDALLQEEFSASLNIGDVDGTAWKAGRPAIDLTRKLAALGRALLASKGVAIPERVDVRCGTAYAPARSVLLASAAAGVLEAVTEQERLNLINARALAAERGLAVGFTEGGPLNEYAVEVRIAGRTNELVIAGAAYPGAAPRITRIGEFHVDVHPRETLLILTNQDVPGVIGRVGTILGDTGANIAEYHQARLAQGGEALAAVAVDSPISQATRKTLLALPYVTSATIVTFSV